MSKMHLRNAPPTPWREERKHKTGRRARQRALALTPSVVTRAPSRPERVETEAATHSLQDHVQALASAASLAAISRVTGLHVNTVRRAAQGIRQAPETVSRLWAVLPSDLPLRPRPVTAQGKGEVDALRLALVGEASLPPTLHRANLGVLDAKWLDSALSHGAVRRLIDVTDAARITGRRGYPARTLVSMALCHAAWDVPYPTLVRNVATSTDILPLLGGEIPSEWACYRFARHLRAWTESAALDRARFGAARRQLSLQRWHVQNPVSLNSFPLGYEGRVPSYVAWSSDPEETQIGREATRRILTAAKASLPMQAYEVLLLIAEGASHDEIATTLGVDIATVTTTIAEAASVLRDQISLDGTLSSSEREAMDRPATPRLIASASSRIANARGRHDRAGQVWRPTSTPRWGPWDGRELVLRRYPAAHRWEYQVVSRALLDRPGWDPIVEATNRAALRLADVGLGPDAILCLRGKWELSDDERAWLAQEKQGEPIAETLLGGGAFVAAVCMEYDNDTEASP